MKALGEKSALQITRFEDCTTKKATLVVYHEKERREERVAKIVLRKVHCKNRIAMSYLYQLTMKILPRKRTAKNATRLLYRVKRAAKYIQQRLHRE